MSDRAAGDVLLFVLVIIIRVALAADHQAMKQMFINLRGRTVATRRPSFNT